MKVKNIENLRNEFFENMKQLEYELYGCNISSVTKVYYSSENIRQENKDLQVIRSLNDSLKIEKISYEFKGEKCSRQVIGSIYITLEDNGLYIYKNNTEKQCYDFESFMLYEDYKNKIVFMMSAAAKVSEYIQSL